jgi:hypothetical protein
VSVAIKNALTNLDSVIDKMEGSLVKHQKTLKNSQIDLFAAPVKPQATGSVLNFDRNALTKKLDMTIARVEQLLGEA